MLEYSPGNGKADFVEWPEPRFGKVGMITYRFVRYVGFSSMRYVPVDTMEEARDRLAKLKVTGGVDSPAFIPAPPLV